MFTSITVAVAVVPQMDLKVATRLVLITANIHPLVVPVQPVELEQMLPTLDRVAVPAMVVAVEAVLACAITGIQRLTAADISPLPVASLGMAHLAGLVLLAQL